MAEYQGWTNYQTWAVKLWLDNDQGSQELQVEMAKESKKADEAEWKIDLADMLKQLIEDGAPEFEASMYSDLLNNALEEINYYEIAEAIINETKENEKYIEENK